MDFSTSSTGPSIGAAIPHQHEVSSLSYHSDGIHLFATTTEDSKLYLINSYDGTCSRPAYKCERDGISVVSKTHHDKCVLTGSTKSNDVNYWSLHDNKILRKFRGHTGPVVDISLCPNDDLFLTSSAKDQSVRLWNVQSAGCIGHMALPTTSTTTSSSSNQTEGTPHGVFDSTGMVFAVMAGMSNKQGTYIHLYDARNYQGGAFEELKLSTQSIQDAMTTHRIVTAPSSLTFNSIEFNNGGNQILLQSEEGLAVILDGYNGSIQRIFQPSSSSSSSTGGNTTKGTTSCFTPDDKTVLLGTDSGTIECWDVMSGRKVKTLEGHKGPVKAIAANPKYNQIASSCTNTCVWVW